MITPDEYEQTIPTRYQGVYRRAMTGKRTAAVKAMCQHCQGYSEGTTKAIAECPTSWCPLWSVRPYQKRDRDQEQEAGVGVENQKPKRVPSQAFMESRPAARVISPLEAQKIRDDSIAILGVMTDQPEGKSVILERANQERASDGWQQDRITDQDWRAAIGLLLTERKIESVGERRGRKYRRSSS